MAGWVAIEVHFAGAVLVGYALIASQAADWLAYDDSAGGGGQLFLLRVGWGKDTFAPARLLAAGVYARGSVLDVHGVGTYGWLGLRDFLATVLAAGAAFFLYRAGVRSFKNYLVGMAVAIPFLWAGWLVHNPEHGMDVILCESFAITGWVYWRRYNRLTPGVLFTSVSFVLWGLVWPVAELSAALHISISGSSVVWDLPKYFVAFGMIMTLFEDQTLALQGEVAERRRAEDRANRPMRPKAYSWRP